MGRARRLSPLVLPCVRTCTRPWSGFCSAPDEVRRGAAIATRRSRPTRARCGCPLASSARNAPPTSSLGRAGARRLSPGSAASHPWGTFLRRSARKTLSTSYLQDTFRKITRGIAGNGAGPAALPDFRHSFASRLVAKWGRQAEPVAHIFSSCRVTSDTSPSAKRGGTFLRVRTPPGGLLPVPRLST